MNDGKPTPPNLPLSGEESSPASRHKSAECPPNLHLCEHPLCGLPAYPTSGEESSTTDALVESSESKSEAWTNSSPDKGRPGGVKGFIPYNKKLTTLARENRKNPTAPETRMWNEVLRARHFADYKFLRQKPIADFIVDFYCSELRLAIEIDGDSHAESAGYDVRRTAALNALGIAVARYTNDEVIRNLEGVYDDLMCKIERIRPSLNL